MNAIMVIVYQVKQNCHKEQVKLTKIDFNNKIMKQQQQQQIIPCVYAIQFSEGMMFMVGTEGSIFNLFNFQLHLLSSV